MHINVTLMPNLYMAYLKNYKQTETSKMLRWFAVNQLNSTETFDFLYITYMKR